MVMDYDPLLQEVMSACAGPATILIVEDDAVMALDLELHLLDMGYRVLGRADSGEQALALAARERPDLVLMDIGLQGDLDGVRTAERLRRQGAMPVIFLTSHTDAGTVAHAVEAAPYGYLTKPVQPGDLRACIQVALVRAHLEEQLLDSEQRWRRVFHDAPLGMALVSLKGEVLQANATLGRLLGLEAAQLRGRQQASLVHPDDLPLEAQRLQELQATFGGAVQFEKRYLRADGSVLWTQVSVSLLEPHAPSPRLLYQVQDLTAQRLAQQQRAELEQRQAQQQAQAQLLSRVSHEMRTPLNAVLGFTQLLRLQPADAAGDQAAQYLEHIETAGRHLLAMVEDLLVLQRAHAGALKVELQTVSLAHSVQHALALLAPLAAAQNVSLVQDVAPQLRVRADPVRLHQIVSNLASNAIKYNRPGGALRVSARAVESRVRLSFADDGIGMTPQQLQELFHPFARAGRERSAIPGTGLGLVISRRLAEAMQGTLDIASGSVGGTVATLELAAA